MKFTLKPFFLSMSCYEIVAKHITKSAFLIIASEFIGKTMENEIDLK